MILGMVVATGIAGSALARTPDPLITTKVKLSLLTSEGVHANDVNVDTVNGQVTLHGKVETAAEKAKAEEVAKKVDGTTGVRNLLQVVPENRENAVQESDDNVKTNVNNALKSANLSDDISVQSVNNGVVLLSGNAKTLSDHLNAVMIASNVRGVRRVASEVRSPNTMGDREIWDESKEKLSNAKDKVGDAASSATSTARDAWITSATKMRLLADSKTPALDINVDTRGGAVTLFGMVPSVEAKAAAESDARQVSGVKTVHNELQVVASGRQDTVKAKDDVIERDLKKSFETRDDLKDINIEVKNCVARLTGKVPSGMQRLEAAVLARSTSGVCSVQDDLQISN